MAMADHESTERRILFFQAQVECLEAHIQTTLHLIRTRPYRSAFPTGDERLITRTGSRVKAQARQWISNPQLCFSEPRRNAEWISACEGDVWLVYSRHEGIHARARKRKQWATERSNACQRDRASYNRDVISLIGHQKHTAGSVPLEIAKSLSAMDISDLKCLLSDMQKALHYIKHSKTSASDRGRTAPIEMIKSMISEIHLRRPETKTPLLHLDGMDIEDIGQVPIASGGFSNVFRGKWHGETVALKVLKTALGEKEKSIRRFNKETKLWAKLSHPCVLEFYGVYRQTYLSHCDDSGERDYDHHDRFYMVSPWMTNGNVMAFCARNPDADRLALLTQVADGLSYLHNLTPPVIHGDLKGDNVLITATGTAVLSDFGLASIPDHMNVSSSMNAAGAIRWMAPELIDSLESEASHEPTCQTDVFAFGMTILQLLTGQVPYHELPHKPYDMNIIRAVVQGVTPRRPIDCPAITDDVWILLIRCWWFRPEGRSSIEEVWGALKKINNRAVKPVYTWGSSS